MILTEEITAKSLLDKHWMKLGAELPDIYRFLVAMAAQDGTPFVWPGMRLLTESEIATHRAAGRLP